MNFESRRPDVASGVAGVVGGAAGGVGDRPLDGDGVTNDARVADVNDGGTCGWNMDDTQGLALLRRAASTAVDTPVDCRPQMATTSYVTDPMK